MITIEQLKAARSLLGWTQSRLAEAAGLSLASVANFEQGKGKSQGKTLSAIQTALEQAGIEFTPDPGVRLRREKFHFTIHEGRESVFELWNDILAALGPTGGEVLMSGIDEKIWLEKFKKELTENILKQRKLKIYPRLLVAQGDHLVLVGEASYRAIPRMIFQQTPYYVYADRFAIIHWGPPQRVMILQNAAVAETFRQQFEFNWQIGRQLDPDKVVVAKLEGLPVLRGPIIFRD